MTRIKHEEMSMSWYTYPNRTLCDTLEEMRKLIKLEKATFEPNGQNTLLSLVEEAQTYANRMESAMEDWSDVREGHEKKHKLKKEIKELEFAIGMFKCKKEIDEDNRKRKRCPDDFPECIDECGCECIEELYNEDCECDCHE